MQLYCRWLGPKRRQHSPLLCNHGGRLDPPFAMRRKTLSTQVVPRQRACQYLQAGLHLVDGRLCGPGQLSASRYPQGHPWVAPYHTALPTMCSHLAEIEKYPSRRRAPFYPSSPRSSMPASQQEPARELPWLAAALCLCSELPWLAVLCLCWALSCPGLPWQELPQLEPLLTELLPQQLPLLALPSPQCGQALAQPEKPGYQDSARLPSSNNRANPESASMPTPCYPPERATLTKPRP
mmetsp:Transcript_45193/g.79562  ORF Transcript_45193/g.79562 Transcript_45193/m.79562 type:complete len:238 (-) Transcript_45193:45-758(-)